jgi:hypothetical protein
MKSIFNIQSNGRDVQLEKLEKMLTQVNQTAEGQELIKAAADKGLTITIGAQDAFYAAVSKKLNLFSTTDTVEPHEVKSLTHWLKNVRDDKGLNF